MSKRSAAFKRSKTNRQNAELSVLVNDAVNKAMTDTFAHVLHDISYRIESLAINALNGLTDKVASNQLNLASHLLDGYTVTDNSPSAGYIAWTDCNVVYKGTNYVIQNGSTNLKYVWWDFSAVDKTLFQTSNTKPTLEEDDVLLFVNDGGIHNTVVGKMPHGAAMLTGTIGGTELGSGAVGTGNIAASAITSTLLAANSVTTTALNAGAVTTAKIGTGAVTTNELGSAAVTTAKIGAGAVTTNEIGASAVTNAKIGSGAVGTGNIAANAVGSGQLANGAVGTTQLAANAVTSTIIAAGAVGATQIGAGAVATNKLNTAMHMIF